MTKFLKTITVAAMMALSFTAVQAQKIAHIDYDSLLSLMPQMDSVKKVSQDYVKTLETQLGAMQNDLTTKYNKYLADKDAGKLTPLIQKTIEDDLQRLQQNIQEFQQSAQGDIQKKNEELSKPINAKAKKAISDVAKEKGYKMVIDSSLDTVLYSEASDDILPFVKTKLGIK